ncbi:hypothetical protein [Leifsonia sp. Leaf264]|uniref:hypothetical protein n=1 Tax=Leifsonia sp. Leaf264 TaxID=1736314 RepID=UPI000ADDCC2B|nr:hypothetical protein [Leifsonia sp. Leaf264]
MTRTITITATWESVHHDIEVPDDFEYDGTLTSLPEDAQEQITSEVASLIDWDVR